MELFKMSGSTTLGEASTLRYVKFAPKCLVRQERVDYLYVHLHFLGFTVYQKVGIQPLFLGGANLLLASMQVQ